MKNNTAPNPTEVSELKIFIDNEADIYNLNVMPIVVSMKKRIQTRNYDLGMGLIPFLKVAEIGAKRYTEQYCSKGDKWDKIFSRDVRTAVARLLQKYYMDEIRFGNY